MTLGSSPEFELPAPSPADPSSQGLRQGQPVIGAHFERNATSFAGAGQFRHIACPRTLPSGASLIVFYVSTSSIALGGNPRRAEAPLLHDIRYRRNFGRRGMQ